MSNACVPEAILEADPEMWGKELDGVPILGDDNLMEQARTSGISHFIVGIGGTGDNSVREFLFEAALKAGLVPLSVLHPSATCASSAVVGSGTFIGPGAILGPAVSVGENVIINSGAIVEHDCQIGDHVHLAPGVRLSGAVTVGRLAHVGTGAVSIQGIEIGEAALVAAGAVVIRDVAGSAKVAGVPATSITRSR
jgi:UDP-perosamine 4-acetyltransferase